MRVPAPAILLAAFTAIRATCAEPAPRTFARRDEPMVDVALACPGVAIELRYATVRNLTGACIYSPDARCYVRQSVAQRLNRAQQYLADHRVGLKVWDAYRPAWVQAILWRAIQNPEFVGDPAKGGSFHTRGGAVDVTLVDRAGRELKMPTDFDDFTPNASANYRGTDPLIAHRLKVLQKAMAHAGFYRLRDEWWHFISPDVNDFAPVEMPLTGTPNPTPASSQPAPGR